MIFAATEAQELFKIRTGKDTFYSISLSDIQPTSITKIAIETDLKTAANNAFPLAEQGWHFYVYVPTEQITTLIEFTIWGGPKDKEPRNNWWIELDPLGE